MVTKADYEAALNESWRGIDPDRTQTTITTQGRKTKTTEQAKAKSSGEKAGEAMSGSKKPKQETAGGSSSGGSKPKKKTNVTWK